MTIEQHFTEQIELIKSLPKKKQIKSTILKSKEHGLWVVGKEHKNSLVNKQEWNVIGIFPLETAKEYINKHKDCFIINNAFVINKAYKGNFNKIF